MTQETTISHYIIEGNLFIDYLEALNYCDDNNLNYSTIIKTTEYK